ncbi:hypothetical protein N7453_000505 [Penicillium expansum]|nr:hypothetical protein N7453_000505 [Penicillium expansum]
MTRSPTLADQRQNIELVLFHLSTIDLSFYHQANCINFASLSPRNSIEAKKRGKSLNVGAESVNPTTY